jgi:tetratricopeptide (TPR) repeat protein
LFNNFKYEDWKRFMPRRPAVYPPTPLTSEDIAFRQTLKQMEPELLGERIRRARQEQKITQRALCRDLFTSAYLSSMELGKTRPTLTTLKQIAERVNKSVAYLLRPAAPGIAGLSQGWQQEQGRLLQLRQGLIQVSVALSKGDFAEVTNLLDQLKPYLSRLPEVDQASYHLWQGALYNRQGDEERAFAELEDAARLLEAGGPGVDPDIAARLDLEFGLAYFNRHQFINALTSFRAGLNRTGLADLNLQRHLQLQTAQCYLILEQPDQAAATLGLLTNQTQEGQTAQLAEANYRRAATVDLQQGAYLFGRSEQIWAQAADTQSLGSHSLNFARLLFQTRQYEAALKAAQAAYRLVSQLDPCTELEILALLALLNNRLGDTPKAQDWLGQARRSMENQQCRNIIVVARYFQSAGEITAAHSQEEAIGFYREALARLENGPTSTGGAEEETTVTRELRGEIYFDLGQLLRQLGRYEEALDFIEKAYRLQ